ncbi:DUF4268 domain-containing protein [Vibrio parahaemolyticus]|uniref:DUF4268 domain-containing protein n=1 Tax=Vibrio parahaemolyticus TaxID=670 RepID=UPI002361717C|nr:DUF4268 domain-containing protein [Vibrio parahaemolyticus]ELB2156892.1 DUF4268 domain-containing protein [Vibrio parahaemolyticus]
MYSTPFIFNEEGQTEHLERISFERGFTESWLQQRLFENPQSLPFGEIDPAYQTVCPLCMEMNTGAGPIDIVYVTPQGRLVIVETKLWRNPEARRKVIGQILDYAKELAQWSFSDLQREVSRRTGIKGNAPYKLVKERFPDVDEAQFVDGVSHSLSRGDFMLIIAGDGIKRDANAIVQFLQDAGNLRFVLAMVETAVYKHQHKDLYVIQPRTLLQTQVIDRTLDYTERPIVDENTEKNVEPWRQQYFDFWSRFLDSLALDDPEQPLAKPVQAGNITFSLPPSGSIAWITTYFYKSNRSIGCFVRFANTPQGRDLYEAIIDEKLGIEKDLPFAVVWDDNKRTIQRTQTVEGNWPPTQDDTTALFFQQTVNGLVNAFRPRLERLLGN